MLNLLQVDAQGLRNGRITIWHGDGFLSDMLADLIRLAVNIATFHAGTCEPPSENTWVMPTPCGSVADLG